MKKSEGRKWKIFCSFLLTAMMVITMAPQVMLESLGVKIESQAATTSQNTYTITYNANGGTGGPGSQIKTEGQSISLSSTVPTRTGWKFLGWGMSNSSIRASYQAGETYSENESITLYAVWGKNINLNYYFYSASSINYSYGVTIYNSTTTYTFTIIDDVPNASVKGDGYTFLGWDTNSSATTARYHAGDKITVSGDLNLYAIWKKGTSTVTYDANYGKDAPAPQTKNYGQPLTLSSQTPTYGDYTFAGWGTSALATTPNYQPGGLYTEDKDITLYAIYRKKIALSYDNNGGTGGPASQEAYIYLLGSGPSFTISSIAPTQSGYSFGGWKTKYGDKIYHAGDTITIGDNLTLYAIWEGSPISTTASKDTTAASSTTASKATTAASSTNTSAPAAPIVKKNQTITASSKVIAIKSAAVSLGAKTSGNGGLTYSSSTPSVATVSSKGYVTPKKYGSTTITIKSAETSTYKAATKKITVTVGPKKMAIKSAKSAAKKKITVTWRKELTASAYQMYISLSPTFKNQTFYRNIGVKTTKYTIVGLKRGKYYYLKIRGYRKVGKKNYFGPWSAVKKVKVK